MSTTPKVQGQSATRQLVAYEIYQQSDMPLEPAPIARQWMNETAKRFAYRCLPLTIANQAGWVIRNPSPFTARWNGGDRPEDTLISFDVNPPDSRISSLFGYGTVTFNMPYLFRTPEGLNLWVKGPTNTPKDAVQALEGVVETDWTSATFTMNWKITRPNCLVRFEIGEPICMVVPYPRGLLEDLVPVRKPLTTDPELKASYQRWSKDRNQFHELVAANHPDAVEAGWQKDYFQGRDPGASKFGEHQTRLGLKPFRSATDAEQ